MKVGTDGVLLGAWAHGGRRVLDVGCGTGVVALMMAQRFPDAQVDAVEIDAAAAAQAGENAAGSPFADRVTVIQRAFQQFRPSASYDAVVSNPPFFFDRRVGPDVRRDVARHADMAFFRDFFAFVRLRLSPVGEVSLVLPVESFAPVADEAYLSGFLLVRRVMVRTVPAKAPARCLVSFSRCRKGDVELDEVCLMDADGSRSAWAERLTAGFYL